MNEKDLEWEEISREHIVQDEWIDFRKSSYRYPDGRVFEPFYMTDKARSRKAGGAGLGLALCEKIVSLHNGHLDIESTFGKGTTVSIYLQK